MDETLSVKWGADWLARLDAAAAARGIRRSECARLVLARGLVAVEKELRAEAEAEAPAGPGLVKAEAEAPAGPGLVKGEAEAPAGPGEGGPL